MMTKANTTFYRVITSSLKKNTIWNQKETYFVTFNCYGLRFVLKNNFLWVKVIIFIDTKQIPKLNTNIQILMRKLKTALFITLCCAAAASLYKIAPADAVYYKCTVAVVFIWHCTINRNCSPFPLVPLERPVHSNPQFMVGYEQVILCKASGNNVILNYLYN